MEEAAKSKKKPVQQTPAEEEKKAAEDYIPVDFDAYTILDHATE